MANSRRRRSSQRSARVRLGVVVAVVVVAALIFAIAIINRQIQGYFTGGGVHHRRVTAPALTSPSPSSQTASALPSAAPTGASPLASVAPGPKVAIIIDDCGYSEARCKLFLQLNIPITLSILPMTPHGQAIEADALAAGKSVMLHLPMQPESPDAHPGPGAITTDMSDAAVQAQVNSDISSLSDIPGANNHMGSKATGDPRVMRDVLEVFQQRHMFFIDSKTSEDSVGESTAHELGIPTAQRDIFLDNQKDRPYILGQLKQVQDVALKRGVAIAIGHPNVSTAQALVEAVPQMEAAGITFVPAATLVK